MKKEKTLGVLLFVGGIILFGMGLSVNGLFPWQLPACFIGGFMIGHGISRFNIK